jgi:ABC-type spermidine/putrescine transport system permease subunit I
MRNIVVPSTTIPILNRERGPKKNHMNRLCSPCFWGVYCGSCVISLVVFFFIIILGFYNAYVSMHNAKILSRYVQKDAKEGRERWLDANDVIGD